MEEFLAYEILDILTVYQLVVIVHLVGLALGAGAAFYSDFLFTDVLKDKKIDKTEYRILKLTSKVVWIGLTVLILSGVLLFLGNSETLLESSKFLAKMTIVSILAVNGVMFHFVQLPRLKKFVNKDLKKHEKFKNTFAGPFFIGGAISGVSWAAALVLGSLSFVDLAYSTIMIIYLAVVAVAILVALKLKKAIIG